MANLSRYLFSISWSDIKDKVFHDRLSREGYTIYYDKYYDFHNKIFDMVMLPSQNILQENTTLFGL
jgi:hypothetical protein